MQRKLIIFVKNPLLGTAKTRLAATIGDEAALLVYRQLLEYTRNSTQQVEADKCVWYSNKIDHGDIWAPESFSKKVQVGNNLGEKMSNAFMQSFSTTKNTSVIIIGSDCAELEPSHIESAFQKLEEHDLVLGPAVDGGYYLLGMRCFYPELFRSITWSTAQVAKQTLQKANELNLSYYLLAELNDVDTIEDLELVKHRLPEL